MSPSIIFLLLSMTLAKDPFDYDHSYKIFYYAKISYCEKE